MIHVGAEAARNIRRVMRLSMINLHVWHRRGHVVPTHDLIKTPDQIAGIKESAKINVAVLDYIEKNIHAGMNTAEIDKIVYDMTTSMGGIPAPLNYEGYPYSVCTSVNEQVCHGFPSEKVILKEGILSMLTVLPF